jgi:anti-sigma regulatory factor (Ser/Thr protein kinase)
MALGCCATRVKVSEDVPLRVDDTFRERFGMTSVVAMITGHGDGVTRVRELLDGLARMHRLHPDVVADMQVALDEVLSNILRHGFVDGAPHRIEVALSVDAQTLTADVADDCAPFDPLAAPPPDRGTSLKDRQIAGLGVHFIRSLMNEVSYARVGARNQLVLRKSLTDEGGVNGAA